MITKEKVVKSKSRTSRKTLEKLQKEAAKYFRILDFGLFMSDTLEDSGNSFYMGKNGSAPTLDCFKFEEYKSH